MTTYQTISLTISSIFAIAVFYNMIKAWFDLKKMEKDLDDIPKRYRD
jgi:hypothetical protein